MNNVTKMNRDFYIKMRIGGTSHNTIISSIFPPTRIEKFQQDISGLEDVDYTKKVNIQKLIDEVVETTTANKNKKIKK